MEYSTLRSACVRGSSVTARPPPCKRGWTALRLMVDALMNPLGPVKLKTVLLAKLNVKRAPVLKSLEKPTLLPSCQLLIDPTGDFWPAHSRTACSVAAHW